MKVILTVQHPAHVHFFRHAVEALSDDGHEVHVFARENEVTVALLEHYGIEHRVLAGEADSFGSRATVQATMEARLLREALRIRPDVMAAIGGTAVSHVAALVGARSVAFTDTEHATIVNRLTWPFADVVCTPACFRTDVGDKQVRYSGYHELAYLHPGRFTPETDVLERVGVDPEDTLAVVRVSSWDSSHDVNQSGFADLGDAVDRLEDAGATVVITSEVSLPSHLEDRQVSIASQRIHDLLAHANVFVGEGATMAAESAVLGTPAVYVSSLTMGYTDELEDRYGLLFGFDGEHRHRRGLAKAKALLADDRDRDWERRREQLLAETRDTTEVIVDVLLAVGGWGAEPTELVADSNREVAPKPGR